MKGNYIYISDTKHISKKINKILKNETVVAICNNLEKNNNLKNAIYSNNVHILNGRYLFKFLCVDIIKYILDIKKLSFNEIEVSILANYLDDILYNNLIILAKKCKILNVITNNPEKFNNISEILYNNYGIIIRISKNKKKSLKNSDIIINFDFTEELIAKCRFNNVVLINLNDRIDIEAKFFNGININFYEIDGKEELNSKYFSKEILYESKIYKKSNFDIIKEIIKKDNIIIKNLIGVNGVIDKKEFV